MSVYYIHAPDLGLMKIGYSARPGERLQSLQTASPFDVDLIAFEDGDERTEALLHIQFRHLHVRGEWFRYEGSLKDWVDRLPRFINGGRKRKPLGGPLGGWLVQNGRTQASFAALIGVPQATISKICSGKMLPQRDIMRRIYVATNGEVDANALFGLSPDLLAEEAAA
jgi:DNA-binding XRE family transcriptional regulator